MSDPTIFELVRGRQILEAEVNLAADAYLAAPELGLFSIAKDYRLDIAAAVEASALARSVMVDPSLDMMSRRRAVRTAILLARPVKG